MLSEKDQLSIIINKAPSSPASISLLTLNHVPLRRPHRPHQKKKTETRNFVILRASIAILLAAILVFDMVSQITKIVYTRFNIPPGYRRICGRRDSSSYGYVLYSLNYILI